MASGKQIDKPAEDTFAFVFPPFGGMGVMALGFEPWLRTAARCNVELIGLASRRAQAYLDATVQAVHCRTPSDLVGAQMRFWQTAAQHYADCMQRMTAACGTSAQAS